MRSHVFVLLGCALSGALHGQYGAGGAGGTWEGIWGVPSQPASVLLDPDRADINVVRNGVDVDNSYFQLSSGNIGLFGFGKRIEVNTDQAELSRVGTSDRAVAVDIRVLGPSFSMRLGQRDVIGFTNAFRTSFAALDLDNLARKFGVDTLVIGSGMSRRLDEATVRAAGVSWSEHGPVYGHTFMVGEHTRLHAAVSATYALGYFAVQAHMAPPVLSGINDSLQTVTDVNLEYALALPNDPPLSGGFGNMLVGQGWNGGGGLILEFLRKNGERDSSGFRPYSLRIGASVTDLGAITFNKRAGSYVITNGSTTLDALDGLSVHRVNQFDTAFSSLLLHDPDASFRSREFRMGMPTALHASVDYCLHGPWAVRAEVVLNMRQPPRNITVRDQLSIVPRFETRMFCAAIPVEVDRFGSVGVGFSARYGGFLIGSDRLGGLFGLNRVSGADIYFGAKVRLRYKP